MQRRTLVLGGACGLALAAMPALAAEAVDPFEWIVALNNSILDEIRAIPSCTRVIRRRFRRSSTVASWRPRTLR